MDKKTVKNKIYTFYNEHAGAHMYIVGFVFKGIVYMVRLDARTMKAFIILDKASRGAGYCIRFKPTVAMKKMLLELGAEMLCTEKYFNELVAGSKYNRGEIFEKLITEYYGQTWEKDNVPFTEQGDINVDGVEIQIKFEKATYINEAQVARLQARA